MSLIRLIYILLLAAMAILALWEMAAGDSPAPYTLRTNDVHDGV